MTPEAWYLSPAFWAFAITAAAFGAFALLLSLRWRGELRSSLLLGMVLFSALWAAASAGFVLEGTWSMWRTSVAFDQVRYAASIAFFLVLLHGEKKLSGRSTNWLAPAALLAISVVAIVVGYPAPDAERVLEQAVWLPFTLMLILAVMGVALVEQFYRRTPEALRWNAWPLCAAIGAIYAYDVVLFSDALLFRQLDEGLWVARGPAQALIIPLLWAAAARNREWTFDVSISRGLLVGSTTMAIAAVYLLVVAAAGYHVRLFGGHWGSAVATLLVFAALLLLGMFLASRSMRAKLRVLVAKNFLAHRYDYREEWLKFTRALAAAREPQSLQTRCICALGDLVETAAGVLWLRRGGRFVVVEAVNMARPSQSLDCGDDLVNFLRSSGWVIDLTEARSEPDRYRGLTIPGWLAANPSIWLVVPLVLGDDLLGFVILGRPRINLKLDWEMLDLLKTAGRQSAAFLAQQEATDALLEARKFESFNRMSAFVVHDLKNLVAQLQLMLRNAERHVGNPDFQRDMVSTVGHAVSRMNHLMLQLRSGETPVDRPHNVDLGRVIERVRSVRTAGRGELSVDVSSGLTAMGHGDRLERVIGHLVQNGFEACAGDPHVVLRAFRENQSAVIEVSDNGAGMSEDFVRDRLFKPFSSTKANGMGIGTYESQQYVNSIGGQIEVFTSPGEGTTFRVRLRAADGLSTVEET